LRGGGGCDAPRAPRRGPGRVRDPRRGTGRPRGPHRRPMPRRARRLQGPARGDNRPRAAALDPQQGLEEGPARAARRPHVRPGGEEAMKLEVFEMERFQSIWENRVTCNLSESGVHPMSVEELVGADEAPALLRQRLVYVQTNGTPALREAIAGLYPG